MQEIFIYGSCVTRDGVEWWSDYGFEMDGYIARQSLISSQSKASDADTSFDFEKISSSFQKRMAIGDFKGNLQSQISACSPNVIVWDLCDERNGVLRFASGHFLTRNILYKDAHMNGEILNFGTDEHFGLWCKALDNFLGQLDGARLIVNATPWAIQNDKGQPVNGDEAKARAFNRNSVRYFEELESRGLEIIRVPQEEAIALSSHKWGEAPFHYVDETYHVFLRQLKQLLG